MSRIKFLNTYIDNLTTSQALEEADRLIKSEKPEYIVTPNLDHIVNLEKDQLFKEAYSNASLILTDGKPLIWISNFLGSPIKEKISGSDFFPMLCKLASEKSYRIFILGAKDEVAKEAALRLNNQFPMLPKVSTYSPPFGFENDKQELKKIEELIKDKQPDILAVALGSPKGEKLIYKYRNELGTPLTISIGATIDFIAGHVKRSPKWMSELGLEWLFRIYQDPRRLGKRYLKDAFCIVPIIYKYWRKKA